PSRTRGRHQTAAQLADHFLPGFRVFGRFGYVDLVQRQSAGLQTIVMATYAILIQQPDSRVEPPGPRRASVPTPPTPRPRRQQRLRITSSASITPLILRAGRHCDTL